MPRYFFSCEGAENFIDAEGTELPDFAAARVQGITNAAEILRDSAPRFSVPMQWRAYVTNEEGAVVFEIRISVTASPSADGG